MAKCAAARPTRPRTPRTRIVRNLIVALGVRLKGTPWIELYRRADGEAWPFIEASGLEESITLESVGCALQLREVYERVF